MNISYNWLKNYINTDLSVERVSEILTDIGLEVEGLEKIESVKGGLEGVVVGEVLTCDMHPDSDHLHITTVNYGDGVKTIVCGAPNVAAGEKVVVATVGCTLYPTPDEEFKIKRSKIRGVESLGMLCAEDELGIGHSHDGIILLDKSAKVGTPASEVFNLKEDYLFEIGLTPNRADAASHLGVARDLAAYLKHNNLQGELSLPSVSDFAVDNTSMPIELVVEAPERAPRYMGVVVKNLKLAPSPEWLQTSLRNIGISPKNNLVDITNFILHELGQPLHAFDYDKIAGSKVVVRTANQGEKMLTLDGIERELSTEDLVICDSEKPMCIAGVFGGANSGVSDTTTSVFIESAYFNPVTVRKSAKRHTLNTDASFRFERGTDPNILEYALYRAALMFKELGGGEIASEVVSFSAQEFKPFEIDLSVARVESLIGKKIGKNTVVSILNALDIEITSDNGDELSLKVPQYRVDVRREVDVVEEIMRIYGFNNIEIPQSVHSTLQYAQKPDRDRVINRVSDFFTSNGFNEIMSNSLTSMEYYQNLQSFPLERCVKIANPLSLDLNVMRQTLLFNALEAIELNTNRKNSNIKFYEFGNCYFYNEAAQNENVLSPYSETFTLGVVVSGNDSLSSWNSVQKEASIFTLKSYIERVLRMFGLNIYSAQYSACQNDIYSDAMSVTIKNKFIMNYGLVSKKIAKSFGIKNPVYYAEINFDNLLEILKYYKLEVVELSKFHEVKRDLALLVDNSVTFKQLYDVALKTEKKLLKSVSLFDVYEGDKLPEGKKSYALNFVLEDTTKTLTDNVIEKCMNNLMFQFEKQLKAEIRK